MIRHWRITTTAPARWTNYGLFTIAVTGLVVTLTSFAGASPEATIAERGIGTLLGGALALGAYALWPTWERTQTPTVLADLLDAYRRYYGAVITAYLDPLLREPHVDDARRQFYLLHGTHDQASVGSVVLDEQDHRLDGRFIAGFAGKRLRALTVS